MFLIRRGWVRVALTACLSGLAVSAMAASQASASLQNVTFTVEDLNPSDGVDPFYALQSLRGPGSKQSWLSFYAADDTVAQSEAERTALNLLHADDLADRDTAQGLASASVRASLNDWRVAGAASGPGTSFAASAFTGPLDRDLYLQGFTLTLSPHSNLTVSGQAFASASADNASACAFEVDGPLFCVNEAASASVEVGVSYALVPGGEVTGLREAVFANALVSTYTDVAFDPATGDWREVIRVDPDQAEQHAQLLQLVLSNPSDAPLTADLGFALSAYGRSNSFASSVPEPTSLALNLLGLAGLGSLLVFKRR